MAREGNPKVECAEMQRLVPSYLDEELSEAQSALLPHLRAGAYAVRQKLSLAAFGFTDFGDFPELIGPFNVVDARGYFSQTVFDLHAIRHAQSEGLNAKAAAEQQKT